MYWEVARKLCWRICKGNEFQSNFIINLRGGGFMKKQNTKTALNYKSAKEMRVYIAEK